jgi:hypothetical protein
MMFVELSAPGAVILREDRHASSGTHRPTAVRALTRSQVDTLQRVAASLELLFKLDLPDVPDGVYRSEGTMWIFEVAGGRVVHFKRADGTGDPAVITIPAPATAHN